MQRHSPRPHRTPNDMIQIKHTIPTLLLTALAGSLSIHSVATAAQVFADDVIVQGSLCTGFDCVNGESFGFDTLRLKENNLRILFQDTSSSASFAANDWRIVINDTENGGANYFAIEDTTAGRVPFRIEAGAKQDALVVEADGDVGIGTPEPILDLHIRDGDSPGIRIEQDGSSGFAPKTYDISANETNFFVRDVTNGSNLVLRIKNNAPNNALYIESGLGDIGVSTQNPDGSFHVRRTGTEPTSLVLEQTGANVKWEIKANAGTGRMTFKDLNGSTTPFKFAPNAVSNLLRVGVAATDVVDIAGNLVISGNCTETDGACADYVFEDDYQLRSLPELKSFIAENRHLPNVPSASEMEENGISIAHISGRLLEKIEELTLYTLQQQETIDELNQRLDTMTAEAQ